MQRLPPPSRGCPRNRHPDGVFLYFIRMSNSRKALSLQAANSPNQQSLMNRAPLSSIFSLLAGATLLIFVVSVYRLAPPQHWTFYFILGWAVMLAAGLIIWAGRGIPKRFRIHWIGNPTLSMVGGVAGSVISAVALSFTLNAFLDQAKTLKVQTETATQQAATLRQIQSELIQIRQALVPQPSSETTPVATPK